MHEEKTVTYTSTNTYETLNVFTSKTKKIWMVCHGIGFLSTYFLEYFKELDPDENYIIAPQAPSKYYQDKRYKYVGASWFTRVNTALETQNVLNYLDAVYATEIEPKLKGDLQFLLLGYSQGVSAATRWLIKREHTCDALVLHSGSIPREFKAVDFNRNKAIQTVLIYGTSDEFLTPDKLTAEIEYAEELFEENLKVISFEGKHEVNRESIKEVASRF